MPLSEAERKKMKTAHLATVAKIDAATAKKRFRNQLVGYKRDLEIHVQRLDDSRVAHLLTIWGDCISREGGHLLCYEQPGYEARSPAWTKCLTAACPEAPESDSFEVEMTGPEYAGDPRLPGYPRDAYEAEVQSFAETIYWRMRFVFKRYAEWAAPWAKHADTVRFPMSVFDMPDILKTLDWA